MKSGSETASRRAAPAADHARVAWRSTLLFGAVAGLAARVVVSAARLGEAEVGGDFARVLLRGVHSGADVGRFCAWVGVGAVAWATVFAVGYIVLVYWPWYAWRVLRARLGRGAPPGAVGLDDVEIARAGRGGDFGMRSGALLLTALLLYTATLSWLGVVAAVLTGGGVVGFFAAARVEGDGGPI